MIILLLIAAISYLVHFVRSTKLQWKREAEWIKKYKFIPDGFHLVFCRKTDRLVLQSWRKLDRVGWFAVPDSHRMLVKQ